MSDVSSKLEQTFRRVFNLPADADARSMSGKTHARWDSIGHITLILAVEQEFSITLTPEEVSDACTFEAMETLVERKTSLTR